MSAPADLLLRDAAAPACFLRPGGDCAARAEDGLSLVDLSIEAGRIARVAPAGVMAADGRRERGLGGGMVFPAFVDCHTHLDKAHIWPRAANPDGTFAGALTATAEDRRAHWTAEDVRRRADFALRGAYAHGTRAIRTHLDSAPPQDAISWPVFEELRAEWAGRITLQAAALVGIEQARDDVAMKALADRVAAAEGVLGAVAYPTPDLDPLLDRLFSLASARGVDLDFHADETQDASSRALDAIARAALRARFKGRVLVGHACALARQSAEVAKETIARVAEAGVAVVSLPLCNLYLQDRRPAGETPRARGVTLLHELRAAGVAVAVASDNVRDPFYAYGDLDMLEVLRASTRIAHLDHPVGDWPLAVTRTPAQIIGVEEAMLAPGAPADLVLFQARSWTELFARPQTDRQVLRGGCEIDAPPPDYAELDDLYAR